MGFYGNITNTSRTQFVFDRTYSSRWAMDTACKTDGVYAGRYVLVEYDTDYSEDQFRHGFYAFRSDDDEKYSRPIQLYTQMSMHENNQFFTGPVEKTKVVGATYNNESSVVDKTIAKIDKEHNIIHANSRPRYFRIIDSKGAFTEVTESDYDEYWTRAKKEKPNPEKYDADLHLHIVNGVISNFNSKTMTTGMVLSSPKYYNYSFAEQDAYYLATVDFSGNLTWSQINTEGKDNSHNYFANFNLDVETYKVSRGYDSTVWQKVYTSTPDGTTGSPNEGRYEKYVMIAELNTVVPTFDICADAPTMVPMVPHFDTDSTNIYYRFHWQPAWGMRMKSAAYTYSGRSVHADGTFNKTRNVQMTTDSVHYPSDQKASWYGEFFDNNNEKTTSGYFNPSTGNWEKKPTEFDAAIYFNKDGFDPENIVYSGDLLDSERPAYDAKVKGNGWVNEDRIQVSPTGLSGNTYKQHNGIIDTIAQPDTQEFSVMLPSLGNAVAKMWDIVYGGRTTNSDINDTSRRNMNIQWEDAAYAPQRKGLRLVNDRKGNSFKYVKASVTEDKYADENNEYYIYIDEYVPTGESDVKPDKYYTYDEAKKQYVEFKGDIFAEDTTYYMHNTYYKLSTGDYDSNATYYTKEIVAQDGNSFDLTDIEANTIAGCINSVHDLMGMIIVNKAEDLKIDKNIASIDVDDIYYYTSDGTFRRKHETFDYTELNYVFEKKNFSTGDSYFPNFFYKKNANATSGFIIGYERVTNTSDTSQTYYTYDTAKRQYTKYTSNTFDANTKYYIQDKYVVATEATRNTSTQYYQKRVAADSELNTYSQITGLIGWTPNVFYKTAAGDYRLNSSLNPTPNVTYYKFKNATKVKFGGTYSAFTSYIGTQTPGEKGCSSYKLAEEATASKANRYYNLNKTVPFNVNMDFDNPGKYSEGKFDGKDLLYIYAPGVFYYKGRKPDGSEYTKEEGTRWVVEKRSQEELKNFWVGDKLVVYDTNKAGEKILREYYILELEGAEQEVPYTRVDPDTGDLITSYVKSDANVKNAYPVNITKFYKNTYYWYSSDQDNVVTVRDENNLDKKLIRQYIALTPDKLKEDYGRQFPAVDSDGTQNARIYQQYYTMDVTQLETFYSPNAYWYNTGEGHWVIDTNLLMTKGRTYYSTVIFEKITGTYYEPNKYFIKDDKLNVYTLDSSLTITPNQKYYLKDEVFVLEDTSDIYPAHSKWTSSMSVIPATIRVGTRKAKWEMAILDGFARTLNTINGLIMRINRLVEFNDNETRDRTTVQGAINCLNDYLNKFKLLPSSSFVITDSYGRLEGTKWTTTQPFSTTNWQTNRTETNTKASTEDRFIYFDLDANPLTPRILVKHRFNKVDNTTTESDKNTADTIKATITNNVTRGNNDNSDDTLKLMTPIVDNMGHVVGHNTETVTLPYGFKTFTFANSSAVTNATNTGTNSLIADNTRDTMALAMSNKWLKFSTEPSNDKFYIGHITSGVTKGSYGLAANETITSLDVDNTFEVPYFTVDEAGHVTAAQTNTVILPENFTKVTISEENNQESDSTGSTIGSLVADTMTDELTMVAGNKWINMVADTQNDKVTFTHYVKAFNETTGTVNYNTASDKTFSIQALSWDKAGHLTASKKTTYTLPDGYKVLSIKNSGASTTTSTDAAAGDLTASTLVDTATIDTGNRWISLIADATNKKVTIVHATAGTASTTKGDSSNQTPKFGSTFKSVYAGIDQTGHVKTLTDHNVTIPLPSLTGSANDTATQASVITTIGLTAADGAFTYTNKNVGNLVLTGYTAPAAATATTGTGTIAATDSISSAFAKAQSYLNHLTARIDSLNYTNKTDSTKFITSLSESNGKIDYSTTDIAPSVTIEAGTANAAPTVSITVGGNNATAKSITTASTAVYGVTKLSDAVDSNSSVIAATSKAVKDTYDLANGKVTANTAITAGTGIKITYDTKGLVTGSSKLAKTDLSGLDIVFTDNANYVTKSTTFTYPTSQTSDPTGNKTIEWLYKKIAYLEDRIAKLEK